MVAEEDRAGAVVMCPNCRRSLKVPSGKDRGMHIASAPSTVRTSRLCQRCGKETPVDSQMCPHCKAVLLDAQGAAPPKKAAPAAAAGKVSAAGAAMAGQAGRRIVLGGSKGGWFRRLSSAGKAGVFGGVVVFLGAVAIVGYFVWSSWYAGQVTDARAAAKAAIEKGRTLESVAKFQEAYELYHSAFNGERYLRKTGDTKDAQMVDALEARIAALNYIVTEPKIRGEVYWRPNNQEEYDQARAELANAYPAYKEGLCAVADAGLAAAQFGKANPADQAGYEIRIGQALDAYVKFVGRLSDQQRAQRTFKQVVEGMRQLAGANRSWAMPAERDNSLKVAEAYLSAAKETAVNSQDDLWAR
jgi:hypothetical protein